MTYELIRSDRKSISLEVRPDGSVRVRAPRRMAKRDIDQFVADHADWIRKKQELVRQRQGEAPAAEKLSMEEIRSLGNEALQVIPERVKYYAGIMGVTYHNITIRNQTTRWGSCSSKGNLNFNCLLMLMPREILDYVVVHELAHRKEMNHSPAFWDIVESVMPDYRERRDWLKEHGSYYMQMNR